MSNLDKLVPNLSFYFRSVLHSANDTVQCCIAYRFAVASWNQGRILWQKSSVAMYPLVMTALTVRYWKWPFISWVLPLVAWLIFPYSFDQSPEAMPRNRCVSFATRSSWLVYEQWGSAQRHGGWLDGQFRSSDLSLESSSHCGTIPYQVKRKLTLTMQHITIFNRTNQLEMDMFHSYP